MMKNTEIMRWLILAAGILVLMSVSMLTLPVQSAIMESTDIQITKSDSPDPVNPGQSLIYTLIVTNNGPSNAINVTLTDNISSKIQNSEYSLDSGTTWNSWTSPLNLGDMGNGDSKEVLIKGIVDPLATGIIINEAIISSDTLDYYPSNNIATARTSIVTANYGVDITAPANQSGNPGDTLTFTFSIKNTGNTADTYNWQVTDSKTPDWITSALSGVTGSVAPSATTTVDVSVKIPSSASGSDFDDITLAATSQGDNTKIDNDTARANVNSLYGVDVTAPANQSGNPGTTLTYTFKVKNTGDTSDSFTLSLSGNSWPSIITSPSSPVTIAAGATQDVSVSVTIPSGAAGRATDTVILTATGTHSQTDSDLVTTTVVNPTSLKITKIAQWVSGPNPLLIGATSTFNLIITVKNIGNNTAEDVTVTDTLPTTVIYIGQSISKGNLSIDSSGNIIWLVGTLMSGEEAKVTITITIKPLAQMTLADQDSILVNPGANTTGRDKPTGKIIKDGPTPPIYLPITQVVFTITKEGPVSANAGNIIRYTINYENVGNGSATDVTIEDLVPEHTTFIGASAGVYNPDTNTFSFYVGAGPAGTSGFITFDVLVLSDLPSGTTIITNQVRVLSYWGNELVDEAESNIVETRVIIPFLKIEKSVNLSKVATGDIVVYTIKVKNISTHDTAEDVKVSDTLPFGIMYLSGSTAINDVPTDDPQGKQPNYIWTIDSIAPETAATITYKCQIGLNATSGYHDNLAKIESYSSGGTPVPLEELPSASARVKVMLLEEKGIIIGKVFEDTNENNWQDKNEPGIPGIRIAMEDGRIVTTDPDGKYSIPGVKPGYHVLTIDEKSVPKDYEILGEESLFVEIPKSGMAKLNFTLIKYKEVNKVMAEPGDILLYTIYYKNNSKKAETGVVISDVVDTAKLKNITPLDGGVLSSDTIIWNIGTVPKGTGVSVHFKAEIVSTLYSGTVILNQATFKSKESALITTNEVKTTIRK